MEESDVHNDETFGSSSAPPGFESSLPSFFSQQAGVTLVDELAGMTMNSTLEDDSHALEEEEHSLPGGTFNTDDDEGGDYLADEKLPADLFSSTKLYDFNALEKHGPDSSNSAIEPVDSSFPLPTGARVMNLSEVQSSQGHQVQAQGVQPRQQQPAAMSPYACMPPPPQVLLCPPGAVPPAQSIAALSTPGQMPNWYQQQHFQQSRQNAKYPDRGRNQNYPSRGVRNQSSIAHGISLNTPAPPAPSLSSMSGDTSTASRRGPPAVKGGVVPIDMESGSDSPIQVASGLSETPSPPPQPNPHPQIVPQQQLRHVSQQSKGPRLPCGERMTPSDVRFVVGKVLQTTETHDPFNDDFYFIQLSMRRHGAKLDKAIANNAPLPPPLPIPLPTWTETKKRIRAQIDESRQHYEDRSRKWETQERVLGHNVKADVSKPRAVLSISKPEPKSSNNEENYGSSTNSLDDMINGLEEDSGEYGQSAVTPFNTVLWNMRAAVHNGYGALYLAQELRQLLNTPLVNAPHNTAIRADILGEAEAAVALVCKSVGLKEPTSASAANTDFLNKIQTNSYSGALLDGSLVAALLQTTKGKKLMRRSICLLMASQRWTLLPVLVARILQRDPIEQSKEDLVIEDSLLATIIEFVQFEESCIVNDVQHGTGIPPSILLVHLRQCIKSVMVSQMETKQLRKALVSSRKRAEVMNIILRLGDQIVSKFCCDNDGLQEGLNSIDPQRQADWIQLRDAFMLMLEN